MTSEEWGEFRTRLADIAAVARAAAANAAAAFAALILAIVGAFVSINAAELHPDSPLARASVFAIAGAFLAALELIVALMVEAVRSQNLMDELRKLYDDTPDDAPWDAVAPALAKSHVTVGIHWKTTVPMLFLFVGLTLFGWFLYANSQSGAASGAGRSSMSDQRALAILRRISQHPSAYEAWLVADPSVISQSVGIEMTKEMLKQNARSKRPFPKKAISPSDIQAALATSGDEVMVFAVSEREAPGEQPSVEQEPSERPPEPATPAPSREGPKVRPPKKGPKPPIPITEVRKGQKPLDPITLVVKGRRPLIPTGETIFSGVPNVDLQCLEALQHVCHSAVLKAFHSPPDATSTDSVGGKPSKVFAQQGSGESQLVAMRRAKFLKDLTDDFQVAFNKLSTGKLPET